VLPEVDRQVGPVVRVRDRQAKVTASHATSGKTLASARTEHSAGSATMGAVVLHGHHDVSLLEASTATARTVASRVLRANPVALPGRRKAGRTVVRLDAEHQTVARLGATTDLGHRGSANGRYSASQLVANQLVSRQAAARRQVRANVSM